MATIPNQTNRIITKGLGGPACKGLVTMHFDLFVLEIIPPQPPRQAGGGPYPYVGGWNQATPGRNPAFFTRGQQQPQYLTPVKEPLFDKAVIKLTFKMNGKVVVKHYVVGKDGANFVITIGRIYEGFKVRISNIVSLFEKIKTKFFDK